jgi:hypothetical protein
MVVASGSTNAAGGRLDFEISMTASVIDYNKRK